MVVKYFLVLGGTCSVSRTVPIALKLLLLFDRVASCEVIWPC